MSYYYYYYHYCDYSGLVDINVIKESQLKLMFTVAGQCNDLSHLIQGLQSVLLRLGVSS